MLVTTVLYIAVTFSLALCGIYQPEKKKRGSFAHECHLVVPTRISASRTVTD